MIELDVIANLMARKGWVAHYSGWDDAPNSSYHTTFTNQDLDAFAMHVHSDGEVSVDLMFFGYEVGRSPAPADCHIFHLSDPNFFEKLLEALNGSL